MPDHNSYAKLRELTTERLVQLYDETAKTTVLGLDFLRQELARREAAEQTKAISLMTKQMRDLTVVITVLTVINVMLAAIPFIIKCS